MELHKSLVELPKCLLELLRGLGLVELPKGLVELHQVLRSELLLLEEPVEAVERKFEVR